VYYDYGVAVNKTTPQSFSKQQMEGGTDDRVGALHTVRVHRWEVELS
jgi:hypothetical protein